ncbi:LysR family transcriptional regulator [Stackebrandtia nassauensis]|uniref:Transcriptional regulator, LysR family n=1 Tax=Stackebrandtia nassauensis (strain DSM 44728 / CIP 108903 / NRRL B-16338 / NBRC 102104 / LLR-40K-21) TaxID=446470 RepID=D3PZB9_STANL|nr:LysR family transcriptional regulator [Stackebrandtia nassauensis]ADD41593.1 transcriptional regulator, LysR family [Stackebrandtia nassauensis DSM 44728]
MLNPRRLLVLREVLAAGSINAAARNLNYSPATISQHMTALARETGLVLFEKQGRGIVATDAARQLADQAAALLADFGRLERVVADLRGGDAEHLAIACFASASESWLPEVVRTVRRHRPNLTVEISLNEPVNGRGRRQPDLDIRTEPADGVELRLDGYRRHELTVEELLAVVPAGHRLAGAEQIALRDLEAEPWVDHDIYDSPIGRIMLSACRAAGFTPRYAARLDDHRAALRLVAAGIGVTVLPRLAVAELPDGLVAKPLVNPTVSRRIVVHARRDRRRGDLIARAVARLRASAHDTD